ncbi:unnamed protein product [Strongylus vulgaris]|uniref:Uncharacterized protein n=1 Tax=Strongylus vulgaris TaxID=40348 RepID=A0A3P7LI73_STRVU|nr:unnamed protein product [Strongylus vulgaris]
MDFGPKGHVNDSPGRLSHALHYNARAISTNADLHALIEPAGIKYHVIVAGNKVQEDGRVGFILVHLDSHEILSPRLAILRLRPLHQKAILSSTVIFQHQQLMIRNLMLFMRI